MHSENEVHVKNITVVLARHDGVLQQIADCENIELPLEVNAANAQLFSKANELLDALKKLARAPYPPIPADCLTEFVYEDDRRAYDEAIREANRIIAKATTYDN